MNKLLNLNQEPAKIAEEVKTYFYDKITDFDHQDLYINYKHSLSVELAISLIENMLNVCQKSVEKHSITGDGFIYYNNPEYKSLSDVLEILEKELNG